MINLVHIRWEVWYGAEFIDQIYKKRLKKGTGGEMFSSCFFMSIFQVYDIKNKKSAMKQHHVIVLLILSHQQCEND